MNERRRRVVAWACLAGGALATLLFPGAAGHAWLAALFFWSGVPVGSIGLLLMMTLVGGAWRQRLAAPAAQGAAALPVAAAAMLPLLVVMGAVYPWTARSLEGFRGAWLQPWAFVLRTLLWFAGLGAILFLLGRRPERAPAVAAAGLIFLVAIGSLIAVDWLMSLDPGFHSSGFGLQALTVQFTVAVMLAAIRAVRLAPDETGTVGALMLALTMLWLYFAYLPFFIIWSGNAPAGARWYLVRAEGGWGAVIAVAVALHGLALLALLSSRVRRSSPALQACAGASLAGNALYAAWLVLPAAGPLAPVSAALFLLALVVIGVPTLLAGAWR